MTKLEYSKCEKLMEEAIRKSKQSEEEFAKANDYEANGDESAEVEQRKADQHYGEAVGINQALAILGFKHEKMNELGALLWR